MAGALHARVDGLLRDKTRPPGKVPLAAEAVKRIVDLTFAEPPGETIHWTGRPMAEAAGVSVGLYIDPPAHVVVLSVDEKS